MTGELKIKSVVRENLDTLRSMLNEYGDFIETRNISDASDSTDDLMDKIVQQITVCHSMILKDSKNK
ncbi:hypothetical protein F4X73_05905 [Candidatus Poribacteria bacterium]|nr:hypothetical protein [Candidatus Poribacteria bacterium]